MADTEKVTIHLACPVPDCGYVPPGNMRAENQHKALERHISLTHGIKELPAVVDAMKAAESKATDTAESEPVTEPVTEPPTEPAKPKETVNVQQRAARTDTGAGRSLASVSPLDPKKERIQQRTEEWGQYLFRDFNPLLVSGVQQFAGIPESWLDGGPEGSPLFQFQTPEGKVLTFWNPPLRDQLALSESDCRKLAKAGANFAESPMGQAVTMWLEHNAHFIALGAALWVAGSYGWRVMRIRTEVTQLKQVLEQQQQTAQPQPGENAA